MVLHKKDEVKMVREATEGGAWYTGKVLTCIAMCFVVVICSGSVHTFTAYSSSLKATFNFTQPSVELMASFVALGGCAHLPGGMALDHLGALWALIFALVLTTGGWSLAWSATWLVCFIQRRPLLMSFYLFIACHGRTYAYMTGLIVAAKVSRPRHSILIIALIETAYDLGPLILVILYEGAFVHGHVHDAENQDLGGYFLVHVILSMAANTAGAILIPATNTQDYRTDTNYDTLPGSEYRQLGTNECKNNAKLETMFSSRPLSTYSRTDQGDVDGKDNEKNCESNQKQFRKIRNVLQRLRNFNTHDSVILSLDYQVLLWAISLPLMVTTFVAFNITYLTHSMYLSEYDDIYVSLNRVFTILGRASTVACLFFCKHILVDVYLIVGTAIICFCQLGMLMAAEHGHLFLASSCGIGFGHGINYVLAPVMVLNTFGKRSMGKNIGLIYTAIPLLLFVLQAVFGVSYHSMITDSGSIYCYGKQCIITILIINQVLAILGVLLAVAIFVRRHKYLKTVKSYGTAETQPISGNGFEEKKLLIDNIAQNKPYLGVENMPR